MKIVPFFIATVLGGAGLAGSQSVTIGPNGVSVNSGGNLTFRLDQNGLRVGVNQTAPRATTGMQTLNCGGRAMTISGSNGRVNLMGRCPSVTVNGSSNTVHIEQVGRVVVTGSRNSVTWRKALTSTRPTLLVTGVGNRVTSSAYVTNRPAPMTSLPARSPAVRTVAPAPVKAVPTPAQTTPPKAPPTAQPLW